ncbi:MAG: hypothetical protein M0P71_05070 [Melioribacteraceae bacterium]|nr:hypothetical protein [Melioribacteraceae bacterium]
MKKYFVSLFLIIITGLLVFSSGCKNSTEPEEPIKPDSTIGPVVKKPNIYLYPTEICSLTIKLEFPLGGRIIESEPIYNDGWVGEVSPTGKINNQYDYLYYESTCPDVYQYKSGWIIDKDSLLDFFSNNLSNTGFNEAEKDDFIEYWIPRLTDYKYYIIYPQYSEEIEKIIQIKSSIKPDNILRLFYVIKGTNSNQIEISIPTIPSFNRNGFVITEWGVVIN